jgi:predicted SAM-dependent methyltransferase
MKCEDITRLSFKDGIFDFIYCSHVLEHIPDDHLAMRELYRVMRPSGMGMIAVPIRGGNVTLEDPTVVTDEDRIKFYGSREHVRYYSQPDFIDRLTKAGFKVSVVQSSNVAEPEDFQKFGLREKERIFIISK